MTRQIILFLFSGACILSCRQAQIADPSNKQSPVAIVAGDNSKNSLEWTGVYHGILPCADCDGIETEIKLYENLTYEMISGCVGKSEETFTKAGSFEWDENGSTIVLEADGQDSETNQYLVGENVLMKLDKQGNRFKGELAEKYNLRKIQDDNIITEKYWKLIELNGKEIIVSDGQPKDTYFILKNESNKVTGFGGCNSFGGSYVLEKGNRIKISDIISTKVFCDYAQQEMELFNVLEMADNYTIKEDTLSLNKARMAPLSKFAAVYF